MTLVGARTTFNTAIKVHAQGPRVLNQLTQFANGDVVPVVDQLTREANRLIVLGLCNKRLAVTHGTGCHTRH